MFIIPTLQRQRQENGWQLEVSLIYIVNSRVARATQGDSSQTGLKLEAGSICVPVFITICSSHNGINLNVHPQIDE